MSSAIVAPAAPAAGSVSDMIDASMTSPADAGSGLEVSTGDGNVLEGEPTEDFQTPEGTETTDLTPAAEAAMATEDDNVYEDGFPKPDRIDGKLHSFKPERIQPWRDKAKVVNELTSAIPGFSVDVAKAHYKAAVGIDQMFNDLDAAQPESVDKVIAHLVQESPQGTALMAMRLPRMLRTADPQAFQTMETAFVGGRLQRIYDEAVKGNNENLLAAAQVIDEALHGKGHFQKKEDVLPPRSEAQPDG